MTAAPPLLDLQGLDVLYGGIQALRSIDLTVRTGEVVTLLGANGAGKSTTLRAVSRLVDLHAGRIVYDGRDITSFRTDATVGHQGTLANAGALRKSAGSGTTIVAMVVHNTGTVEAHTGTLRFLDSYSQTAGTTALVGGNLVSTQPLQIQGGTLSGQGVITANVSNAGGSVASVLTGNTNIESGMSFWNVGESMKSTSA